MKLVGLMPVRNEEWILGCSLRVALKWCDQVIVYLHCCVDASEDIATSIMCEEKPDRVTLACDDRDQWDEMGHRQWLLETARQNGATHIAMIDADEVLTANLFECIRPWCETLPKGVMLNLPGYNLRGGLRQYHSNGVWGSRWFSTVFRDEPGLSWSGDTFHHREPFGANWRAFKPAQQGAGGVLHFWGASERRLRAKHALYKVTERIRWPKKSSAEIEAMYNLAVYPAASAGRWEERWCYMATPTSWLPDNKLLDKIQLDLEPWQESECRRLVAAHPGIEQGLDLFGVV